MTRKMRSLTVGLILVWLFCAFAGTVFAAQPTSEQEIAGQIVGQIAEEKVDDLKETGSGMWERLREYLGDSFPLSQYYDKVKETTDSISSSHFHAIFLLIALLFLVVTFFGYRLFKLVISLLGFGIGALLGTLLMGAINRGKETPISGTVVWIAIVVFGLLGAFLAFKIYKLGVFLSGAVGGYWLGGLLLPFINEHITTLNESTQKVVPFIIAAVVGILTMLLVKPLLVIVTSAVGGWYAAENLLATFGFSNRVAWSILAIVLIVAGMVVQFRRKSH